MHVAFPSNPLVSGVTYIATSHKEGVITSMGLQRLFLGLYKTDSDTTAAEKLTQFCETAKKSGIEINLSEDIQVIR